MKKRLDRCEDGCDVIGWRPAVLQDVKTKFSVRVDIRVEHSGEEFYGWRFVWVSFFECEKQFEGAVFEWCVGWVIGKRGDDCILKR